jgi:PAP2 superfamily
MKITPRSSFYSFLYLLVACISFTGCSSNRKEKIFTRQDVATAWADMALYVAKKTPANSPTFASRGFGYIGVAMYESIVHGYPTHQSLSGQLNGLTQLPLPENDVHYDWVLSLNAGQAYILKKIYNQTSDANKLRIDSLEDLIFKQFSKDITEQVVVSRSVSYGKKIAEAVFQWSLTDGGHRAYLHNFDKKIISPTAPGSWEPPLYGQSFSHYPLHPHWGNNRTFVKENAVLPTPEMIRYDSAKQSDYYQQFKRVYDKSKTLTPEEKEIALWWNDDPGETFTPPGHSFYLAVLVLKKENPELIKCAETLARVGMAVADAFVSCWKWKYHYFSERPSSYITRKIDARWESFWPDPPFPAFPSGHATQSAAASTVLIDLYGDKFTLTDSAHVGRPPDELRQVEFKPRTFESFWQITQETANSRFFGGIHSPQDNEVGLVQGKKIGQNVNLLNWSNEEKITTPH